MINRKLKIWNDLNVINRRELLRNKLGPYNIAHMSASVGTYICTNMQ